MGYRTGVPHLQEPVHHGSIFHKLDEMKKELEDRIANLGKPAADGDAAKRFLDGSLTRPVELGAV